MFHVIVVGGGPAGLSAALMLGRCRRRVLLIDNGSPRNGRSSALHGYLTRDGTSPAQFNAIGRAELARYGVVFQKGEVVAASSLRRPPGFRVTLRGGSRCHSRFLLLATGVADVVPDVPGLRRCYGRSVFHCPYCDGWEWRDRRLGVLADGISGARLALSLKTWSAIVEVFLNGSPLTAHWRDRLARNGIAICDEPLARLEHDDGRLHTVRLASRAARACDAIFFSTGQYPQSQLAIDLECERTRKGTVRTGRLSETNVSGVFVAGDASHDAQYVAVASAEGLKAALAINQALQSEELLP